MGFYRNKLQWWRSIGGGEWAKLEHPENLRLSISERQILGLPWAPWFGQALGRAGVLDTSAPMDGAGDGTPLGSGAGDPPISIEPVEVPRTSPRPHFPARTYTVMAGDGMQAIARKLGAGARTHWYRELVSVNLHKPIDWGTRAWFTLTPGEVINVPDVWPAKEADARGASVVEVAWSPRSGAAPALLVLRDQLDARWPHRRRVKDGIVAHHAQNPRSDHEQGNALDVTRDPEHGPDLEALARTLLADPRTHYVIFDRRIANPNREGGAWRPYGGGWRDPHQGHLHVSIWPELREDARRWALDEGEPAAREIAPLAASSPPAPYRAVRDDSTQGIGGKWPGSMVSADAGAPEPEDMGPYYMHSIVDLIDGGNAVWRWRPIDVSFRRPGDKQAVIATFWVLVDAVSDRRTGLRWPCSAAETQMVADRVRVRPQDLPNWWGPPGDALPCLMMTSRLSDARWLAARDSHEIIPPHPDSVTDSAPRQFHPDEPRRQRVPCSSRPVRSLGRGRGQNLDPAPAGLGRQREGRRQLQLARAAHRETAALHGLPQRGHPWPLGHPGCWRDPRPLPLGLLAALWARCPLLHGSEGR